MRSRAWRTCSLAHTWLARWAAGLSPWSDSVGRGGSVALHCSSLFHAIFIIQSLLPYWQPPVAPFFPVLVQEVNSVVLIEPGEGNVNVVGVQLKGKALAADAEAGEGGASAAAEQVKHPVTREGGALQVLGDEGRRLHSWVVGELVVLKCAVMHIEQRVQVSTVLLS